MIENNPPAPPKDIGAWHAALSPEAKYVYDLIEKNHTYFSKQDNIYRWVVRALKIVLLTLTMANTIVLGLKTVILIDTQILIGLILSSFVSFLTALSSYFNVEQYWMRNISIHIELNILRDSFIFEAKAKTLTNENVRHFMNKIEEIQLKNKEYWNVAVKKI